MSSLLRRAIFPCNIIWRFGIIWRTQFFVARPSDCGIPYFIMSTNGYNSTEGHFAYYVQMTVIWVSLFKELKKMKCSYSAWLSNSICSVILIWRQLIAYIVVNGIKHISNCLEKFYINNFLSLIWLAKFIIILKARNIFL